MILLVFRDGSHMEIPHVADVQHDHSEMSCIDASGRVVLTLAARDVLGYTMNAKVAHQILDESESDKHNGRPHRRSA